MSSINPYRAVQVVAVWIGRAVVIGLSLVTLAVIVAGVWQSWGAWALTVPLIIAATIAGMIYLGLLISDLVSTAANRLDEAAHEWESRGRR